MNAQQSTIVAAMAVTGASVYVGSLAKARTVTVRPAVGIMITGAVLLVAANSAGGRGDLAAQFAVLVATTAVLTSGYIGLAAIARYLNPPKGNTQ